MSTRLFRSPSARLVSGRALQGPSPVLAGPFDANSCPNGRFRDGSRQQGNNVVVNLAHLVKRGNPKEKDRASSSALLCGAFSSQIVRDGTNLQAPPPHQTGDERDLRLTRGGKGGDRDEGLIGGHGSRPWTLLKEQAACGLSNRLQGVSPLGEQGVIGRDQHVRLSDVVGPYCRSKLLAERHAFALARQGAPVVVVNPTLPVGPGDRGRSPPTQMVLDFCRGRRKEYVDAALNLIDVRDVADGMMRAMARGVPGRRYLLGHENLSIREVFRLLAQLTGLPEPHRCIPYAVALAVAYVSEWLADVALHRGPAATVTGVKLTRRVMHFDASSSLAELGLQPRPIVESLRDAVAWFRMMRWM
jgi:hypothetical protein